MRKISLLALIFIVIMVSAAGQLKTITVGSPRAGDVLCKGRTYQIQWTSSGVGDRVMIQLISSGGVVVSSTETENDGLYKYTVPSTTSDGNYTLAISTLDGKVRGVSGSFRIDSCLAEAKPVALRIVPRISVISPNRTSGVWVGGYQLVHWTWSGDVPNVIGLTLHSPDCAGTGTLLASVHTRTGQQWVRIPPALAEGNYSIRAGLFGSDFFGCSNFDVHITSIITQPTATTVWHPGEGVVVRWRAVHPWGGPLRILYSREGDPGTIPDGIRGEFRGTFPEDAGAASITIPADLAPGRYFLTLCPSVSGGLGYGVSSDLFHIRAR